MMDRAFLDRHERVLMEAAIVERLRREFDVELHPVLVNAALPRDEAGRGALRRIYCEYVDVARQAGLPLLLCTPTWRANRERLEQAGVSADLNGDAVRFLKQIVAAEGGVETPPIFVGGLIGCRNDCYRPQEGLATDEAERFHAWQLGALARAGADFLIAETLPHIGEAVGIGRAMAATGVPFVISFVIDREGRLLDGTALIDAVRMVDAAVASPPLGFMINCTYPTFLRAADQPPELFERLIGFQANASSLDHAELDGSTELQAEDIPTWGDEMLTLHRRYGVKILGGCCGTGVEHLRYLADRR
jgi:S-methylmethionine-dependent homocysteine/selenocysteine methylase